jgi:two-component system sensor histidine kinase YesM
VAAICSGVLCYQLQSHALYERAGELIAGRAEQAAQNIANYFGDLKESALFLAADDRVQSYLLAGDGYDTGTTALLDGAYSALNNTVSLRGDLAFAYIVKQDNGKLLYIGPPKASLSLDEGALPEPADSLTLTGPVKNPVASDGSYVFLIWQQIYDIYQVRSRLGSLCFAAPERVLAKNYLANTGNDALSLSVVDADGRIVSDPDPTHVTESVGWFPEVSSDGTATIGGELVVRAAIEGTGLYVAGAISERALAADSAYILTMVAFIIIGAIAACALTSIVMSRRITAPFRTLTERMARVSTGDFESTIDLTDYGGEYVRLADGYNAMIGEIGKLLISVRETERLLADSELKMLKAQINPHFLYNTLDSIHWLAAMNDQQEISTMVKALADFYRICLGSAHERIRLADELKHASSYLTIQKIRYSDVVESTVEADPEDMELLVPSMILQPLIENAIYHGLKGGQHRGTIQIREYRAGGDLYLEVRDDGRGMSDEDIDAMNLSLAAEGREGHGAGNVHRRIELICGREYGLRYSKNADGGLCVTARLPIQEV